MTSEEYVEPSEGDLDLDLVLGVWYSSSLISLTQAFLSSTIYFAATRNSRPPIPIGMRLISKAIFSDWNWLGSASTQLSI